MVAVAHCSLGGAATTNVTGVNMNRKAIQLANNTLVVSLPAKWVQDVGVAKGEDLDVSINGQSLVVSHGASVENAKRSVKIDISGMSASLVWNYLNSVYRTGFDEIEIYFEDSIKKNLKTGRERKTIELISNITDKLLGMEIIRQSKNTCILKEVTLLDREAYDNVLNRTYLSLINIAEDMMTALSEKDFDTLERIHKYSEVNVNKLSDYCLRILNSSNQSSGATSNLKYLITFLLEEIGDVYADMARTVEKRKKLPSSNVLKVMEETNSLLEFNYKLFLKYDKDKLVEFHEKRFALKQKINTCNGGDVDFEVKFLLKQVLDKLMEINNCLTTLNVDSE